jgi:hypothetical protein
VKHDNWKAARQLQRDVEKQRWAERKHKKDAVLHLRIEGDVMDRIKVEAAAREMSVSDLVRCHLVERFSETCSSGGSREFLLTTSAFSDVVIMKDSRCAVCGRVLLRGTSARLAYGPPPPARLVCGDCYDGLQSQFDGQHEPSEGEK